MTTWRERCFCGAEFEYSSEELHTFRNVEERAHTELSEWRIRHARSCPGVFTSDTTRPLSSYRRGMGGEEG